jgi:hypothetical protein
MRFVSKKKVGNVILSKGSSWHHNRVFDFICSHFYITHTNTFEEDEYLYSGI